jgi:hypothetical protein
MYVYLCELADSSLIVKMRKRQHIVIGVQNVPASASTPYYTHTRALPALRRQTFYGRTSTHYIGHVV